MYLLRFVYCSFLEYCSIIWSPYHLKHNSSLESVQNNFSSFLYHRYIPSVPHTSHDRIVPILFLDSLNSCRIKHLLCFLYNINCPEFFSRLSSFCTSTIHFGARRFYFVFKRTNYAMNSPLYPVMYFDNKYNINIFLNIPLDSFKQLLNYISLLLTFLIVTIL